MMKYTFILLCCIGWHTASAQAGNDWIQQKIDSLVNSKAIPGIIVGISDRGVRRYYSGGFANKDTRQPFDAATQVEIGSITKTMTAYLLTAVLQEQKISDTTAIGPYLPDSVRTNLSVSAIRFVELMNHTSGLPRLPENINPTVQNPLQPYAAYGPEHLYAYLAKAIPDSTRKVSYSNLGAGLAGILAARISGIPYEQLLKKYITLPYGMQHTDTSAAPGRPFSTGYFNEQPAEYWTMHVLKPAGGVKSDAADMLTYLEQLIRNQQSAVVSSITTPTASINNRLLVAKGWHILIQPNQPSLFWHNGGTFGFSSFCAFHKESGKALFLSVNAFNKNNIGDAFGIEIMTKLLQHP